MVLIKVDSWTQVDSSGLFDLYLWNHIILNNIWWEKMNRFPVILKRTLPDVYWFIDSMIPSYLGHWLNGIVDRNGRGCLYYRGLNRELYLKRAPKRCVPKCVLEFYLRFRFEFFCLIDVLFWFWCSESKLSERQLNQNLNLIGFKDHPIHCCIHAHSKSTDPTVSMVFKDHPPIKPGDHRLPLHRKTHHSI